MIAFVIGGSTHVMHEIKQAYELVKPDMVVVINDIGTSLTKFDHWVTLHPDKWKNWLASIPVDRLSTFQRWSPQEQVEEKLGHPDELEPPLNLLSDYEPSGLSGLYAVKVALHCGADKVILVGIPMDQSGHYTGNKRRHWISPWRFKAWYDQFDVLQDRVKSLSGRTQTLLGAPTQEWLQSELGLTRAGENANG